MDLIPKPDQVVAAAGNVAHTLLYGGLADLRPMPRTLIDDGELREVYHYRPAKGVEPTGDGVSAIKNVIFLNNLMPINFLFFGVPTEIIDQTLAQLLSVTANLHRQAPKITAPRVFAIDYDRIASENVYGAVQPLPERDIPIPPSTTA